MTNNNNDLIYKFFFVIPYLIAQSVENALSLFPWHMQSSLLNDKQPLKNDVKFTNKILVKKKIEVFQGKEKRKTHLYRLRSSQIARGSSVQHELKLIA